MKFYSQSTGGFYASVIHGDAIPSDAIDVSEELYQELMNAQATGKRIVANDSGAPVAVDPPQPTQEQIYAAFIVQIQQRLDGFARTRNYDGILSACTYATDPDPKFSAEGQACVNLRSATWAAAYKVLADVQSGKRAMPASLADIEADLPVLKWPV